MINNQLLRMARGVLLLDQETFVEFKTSRNVFARGALLVVTVSLIVGLVASAAQLLSHLTAPSIYVQRQFVEEEINRALRSVPGTDADTEMLEEAIRASVDVWWGFVERIAQLPTPLPRPARSIFQAVGALVSAPLVRLGRWILFTLIVFVVAKLMGGRGTVQEMLGTTALYIIPHIAGVLSPVAYLRTILGVVSTVWGIVIYVKATAVANEIDNGRAALAVFLPVLVPVFLAMLLFTILVLAALTGQ